MKNLEQGIEASTGNPVFYQLIASGHGQVLEATIFKIVSRKIFTSKAKAEEYQEEFFKICTTMNDKSLDSISPAACRVAIVELELTS